MTTPVQRKRPSLSIVRGARAAKPDALSQSCQAFTRARRDAYRAARMIGGSTGSAPLASNVVAISACARKSPSDHTDVGPPHGFVRWVITNFLAFIARRWRQLNAPSNNPF